MKPLIENRRLEIEALLAEKGVEIDYGRVPLAKIKLESSHREQVRTEVTDPEVVKKYATVYRRGSPMPPVVVSPDGDGYFTIDGNQRVAAALSVHLESLDAYFVRASVTVIIELSIQLNAIHGWNFTDDESLAQTVRLVEMGYTHANACTVTTLAPYKLRDFLFLRTTDKRLERLGVPAYEEILEDTRRKMNVFKSDKTLGVVVKLIRDVPRAEQRDLIARIQEQPLDDQIVLAERLLKEKNEATEIAASRLRGNNRKAFDTPRMKVLRNIGGLLVVEPEDLVASCVNDDQREDLKKQLTKAATWLKSASRQVNGS